MRKHNIIIWVFLGSMFSFGNYAWSATIAVSCGAVGIELELCKSGARAWAKESGHEVEIVSTPNSSSERLALYQQLLAAGSQDIDVFQIDIIWPGILKTHLADLTPHVDKLTLDRHFQPIVENNTIDGKLVALPWFTDAGVLYYRKDLLEKHGQSVPTTWQELTDIAAQIQTKEREGGNDKMWGYVWQGRAYEGLTCNALEWIGSFGGGAIVDGKGKITINNPKAVEAVDLAASWIEKITPQGVLNYDEEQSRGVFQSGNAVFMRNWPYAWTLANSPDSPIRGKTGVAALPKGGADGRHTGTLGGWNLAVSNYSPDKKAAIELIKYLTSQREQKRRAIQGGYNPTIVELYKDKAILEANPFFGELYDTFVRAIARPSDVTGVKYNQVSNAFWNAVHATLSGKSDAQSSLARLERRLNRLSRGGRAW